MNNMTDTADNKVDRSMLMNQCLEALALALEYDMKDYHAHQHAVRVGEGCGLLAKKMGLSDDTIQQLYYAGLLHDIGKISVDPALLAKKGGLSDEDFEIVKNHTVHGGRIIATLPGLNTLSLWVRWHHEWWDGSGYPDGLAKNEIPLEVQILSTIDCFDSLQTPRLDRERRTPEEAYQIINEERNSHFNPRIADMVMELVQEKAVVPGKSSEQFLKIKAQCIDRPLTGYDWGSSEGLSGLYPILKLFAQVIDAKHTYTRGHSTRVSILSKYMAEKINLSSEDVVRAEIAGLLHDAGKVSVAQSILDKPSRPDEEEWKSIQKHPSNSFDILSKISTLSDIAWISASHHEKYDGTGYPNGLKGDEIHVISHIIAIADTYDAITSSRAYRPGQPPEKAFKIIEENLGGQFHPEIGRLFINTSPKYITALFDNYSMTVD